MAYVSGGKGSNRGGRGQQDQDDSWKATAFINIYIPGPNGKRKLGSIPLKDSKAFEAAVIERLKQEGGLEALAKVIELDFQLADKEVDPNSLGF